MKERVIWIDQLKGVAILLVVIGHILWFSMGFADVHINGCLLLKFIYSFHMPLFIFLSGLVINSVPNVRKLLSKICQFCCPLLFVGVLYSYYIGNDFSMFAFSSTKLGYWYLWVLSIFYVLYYLLYRNEESILSGNRTRQIMFYLVLPILIWIALKLLVTYIDKNYTDLFCLRACSEHWPYFCIGIWCGKFRLLEKVERWRWLTSFALLLYIVVFWLLIAYNLSFHGAGLLLFFYPFTTILLIAILWKNNFEVLNSHVSNQLSFLGRHTLDIYIIHMFFIGNMNLLFLHDYFADSSNTILLILLSLLIAIVVAYSSVFIGKVIRSTELSKIVYGKFFKS